MQNLASSSIHQSFSESVHQANAPSTSPVAHVSGQTTASCDPPLFLLVVQVSVWEQLADPTLRRQETYLRSIFLPATEPNAVYSTEGDVVAGAALELLHPVHMALSRQIPSLRHGSEASKASARADKVYFQPFQNQDPKFRAVLDFKKVSVIIEQEFQDMTVRDSTTFSRFIRHGRETSNTPEEEEPDSNAKKLPRQGVHYSEAYETPFVAFFDMRTLVLLVFVSREGKPGGTFAHVTVVTEPERMRKALLGFLYMAATHETMSEYDWKGRLMTKVQRGWFAALKIPWMTTRRSSRLEGQAGGSSR